MRLFSSRRGRRYRPCFEMLEDRINPVSFGSALGVGASLDDFGRAVATDAAGNCYVAGSFQGSADFDPGPGTTTLTSAGAADMFVAKYTAAGALVWAHNMGGTGGDDAFGLAVDAAGSVYITGSFNATADFDPGVGTFILTSAGSSDIFVCKLDSGGNFVWARAMGGTSIDSGQSIAVDAAGNVYTTGRFWFTADFDPGAGTVNLVSAGSDEIFVSKLDSAGNFVWADRMGGTMTDQATGIALDAAANVYVTGNFGGTSDFDPGAGTFNLTTGGANDIFITKLDTAGGFLWANRIGGTSIDLSYGIAVDAAGNVYTTGSFNFTVDFDPGAGTFNLTAAGLRDVFVSKLDSAGNFIWASGMGGTGIDEGLGITVDAAGNVFTTGYYTSTVDFDPGAGTFNLTSFAASNDVFVSKLDSTGTFVWAASMGSTTNDRGQAIAVNTTGNVFTTGFFQSTADFDPEAGTFNITSAGMNDIFVSMLVEAGGFPMGVGSSPHDQGQSITTDAAGNLYVTGYFQGTCDFDSGTGTATLTTAGVEDIFVAKYSATGGLVWARSMGGAGIDTGYYIAVDVAGNVYVTGSFRGTADFDPGAGTFNLTSPGSSDIFIAKLDSAGNFVWARSIGGTSQDDDLGIAVDAAGNVHTTGRFGGTVDFDPGAGTFNLTSAGLLDIFIAKLDSAGNFIWASSMGGALGDIGNSIALDAAGNVYAIGSFGATADFDPGAGTFNLTSAGSDDIFIAKLDSAGNFVWASSMGGTSFDYGFGITVDASGNVTTSGSFNFTVDFDPGPGTFNLTSAGAYDICISRLDSTGTFVWARKMGSGGTEYGKDIVVDAAGYVYTTGYFNGTVDFDPSAGSYNLTSAGLQDIFLSKLDSAGNFVWAGAMGGPGIDEGAGIAVDLGGNVYTTGRFQSTVDFDPGPGTFNLTSAGGDDIFVAKLTQFGVSIVTSGGFTSVNEGGATDTVTVVLNTAPTADVIITLAPNVQLNVAPTILTFNTANWNVAQTITVTAVDDALLEGNHTGVISFTTSSADTNYNTLAIPALTAAITDNDVASAGVILTESAGTTAITEGASTDTYTVVLTSAPTANVTIDLSVSSQYTTSPTSLVFTSADWSSPQTVIVTAVDDALIEGAHTAVITHTVTSADTNYNGLAISSVTASITDNDFISAGVTIAESAGSTDVSEAGISDSYTAVLNSAPTANVTIALSAGSQLNVSPTTLVFTPVNWNVPQPVLVQAIDDAIAQGTRSQTITHSASSTDPLYNGLAIAAVTANITDNDIAGITLSAVNVDVSEGGSSNTYTVVLNTQPSANVVVALAGDSQVSLGTATLIFTPVNWNVPQVVSVSAIDDALAEGLHNGLITHTAASADAGYSGMTRTMTARISDNESPGVLISQTNGPMTILEGTGKTYTAVLNAPPSSDVVLNISPDSQVSVSPLSITFTPGDWNVPRPVVVTAIDDAFEEGDHLGRITHTTSSATAAFNNLTVASITAGIVDNEGVAVFGTERADSILVSFAPAGIKVTVSGKTTSLPSTLTQLLLYAGSGNDSIQILAPTIPVVVIGGPGSDKVFVTGQAAANNFVLGDSFVTANGQSVGIWESEALTVGGKAGNDTFTVQGVAAFPVELKGDVGSDVVIGPDRPNTWQITGANAGTLDSSIKLTALESWTGGASADSFAFAPGKSLTGRIDGGAGQNTLDFAAATAAITVNLQTSLATGARGFANITSFVGGKGGADKIIAADQSNVWNVTGQNAGNVNGLAFRNFEHLTGGAFDDAFLLADNQGVKGKIDGAGGSDSLDYSAYLSRPLTINLQLKSATNTGGFANLEQFQAGAGGVDTLVGLNKINLWKVLGPGSGDVAGIAFDSFENLTGGTLADTFNLAAAADWLGTLNGGTGIDTLVASPGSNRWIMTGLNAGTLNGRKFAAVEIRR